VYVYASMCQRDIPSQHVCVCTRYFEFVCKRKVDIIRIPIE